MVLDVENGSTEDQAKIIQNNDTESNSQLWALIPMNGANLFFTVVNKKSGKSLYPGVYLQPYMQLNINENDPNRFMKFNPSSQKSYTIKIFPYDVRSWPMIFVTLLNCNNSVNNYIHTFQALMDKSLGCQKFCMVPIGKSLTKLFIIILHLIN